MTKNYRMDAETGSYGVTGQKVQLTHTVIRSAVEKNWPYLCTYLVVTASGIVASYFVSGLTSVAVSIVVAVMTFFVGLKTLRSVATVTHDRR